MMRGLRQYAITCVGARHIVGVAPVLHLGAGESPLPKDQQVKRNTNIALSLIKKFKGPTPAPYTRRHTQSFEAVEKEIDLLVGGAAKSRRSIPDNAPLDKITLIERCLRHAMWSYLKEEGRYNFPEMERWLVYTPTDATRLAQLRRDAELKEKLAALKKRQGDDRKPVLPTVDWAKEYNAVVDRELVVEKRHRYDSLSQNVVDRDEAQVEALLKQYRQPQQDKRLDNLIDMLERFKPVLAREAIMQRLTIKHLEGQLGIWRYLDWNPEVRDRAELETDNYAQQWWNINEEGRMLNIRLRSVNEVKEVMEKKQSEQMAAQSALNPSAKKTGGNVEREKLLQEVLRLQSRLGRRDDEAKPDAKKQEAKAHH